jgi:eukaryotic-like serine/threonine-protein kinase
MDLVEGLPIHKHCARHSLDWREVVQLFGQLCRALGDAHQRLVLHCDIKPANIFVTPQGMPMILDLGISQALSAATLQTSGREHAFTPRYASPEQAKGSVLTTASDVYSLGKVLARCTEELPSTGLTREELDAVVHRCTQEDPEQRYPTMGALAADLDRLLADQTLEAMPRDWLYTGRKLLRRRKGAVAAAALAACAAVAFTLDSNAQRNRALAAEALARQELARATEAQRIATTERDRAREASSRAQASALAQKRARPTRHEAALWPRKPKVSATRKSRSQRKRRRNKKRR